MRSICFRRIRLAPALLLIGFVASPAHAVSKETIQLQTQVQQLIDAVARLQQSNDERMGVMRDLLQQTVDSVNKMSVTVSDLQTKMQAQGQAQATRNDQLSGQVQALNDSMDELRARIQRIEKSLTDLQGQAQSTNAMLGNLPGAGGAPATVPSAPAGSPPASSPLPSSSPAASGGRTSPAPAAPGGLVSAPAPPAGPSSTEMYRLAYSDYMAGKYPVAGSEFSDLVKAYPDDNLAGNALFYLGEIDRRNDKAGAAIKSYDRLLERYPDNTKIPAAHLHKAEALIAMRQNEAGARELRTLLQRFPNSPEAAQARTRLNALGGTSSRR